MSVLGEFRRLSPELLEEIRQVPEEASLRLEVLDEDLDLDREWSRLAALLDRAGFSLNPITGGALFPNEDEAWGWANGDSRALTAEQVTQAAAALSRTPFEVLGAHLRPLLIEEWEGHVVEAEERAIRERLSEAYEKMVEFFAEAAARRQCTVFWAA